MSVPRETKLFLCIQTIGKQKNMWYNVKILRSKGHNPCVVLAHKQGLDLGTQPNTNKKAVFQRKIAIYECWFGFRECEARRNPWYRRSKDFLTSTFIICKIPRNYFLRNCSVPSQSQYKKTSHIRSLRFRNCEMHLAFKNNPFFSNRQYRICGKKC